MKSGFPVESEVFKLICDSHLIIVFSSYVSKFTITLVILGNFYRNENSKKAFWSTSLVLIFHFSFIDVVRSEVLYLFSEKII